MRPRWISLAFTFGLLLVAAAAGNAQVLPNQVTPDNATGVQPYNLYGGVREDIAYSNGNLNLYIPLVSLPGRNGMNLDLGLEYDSKIWQLSAQDQFDGSIDYWWKYEKRGSRVGYMGWRLSIPHVDASWVDGCTTNFVVTLQNGSKHVFKNRADCANSVPLTDSNDASFMELNTSNTSDIVLRMKDGTQIHFGCSSCWATKIVDTDGNIITIQQLSNPPTVKLIDTLGREVTINNFNMWNCTPSSITYKDSNGSTQTISFTYTSISIAPTFAKPVNSPTFHIYVHAFPPGGYSLLTGITMPNQKGYTFTYNTYAELTKITYPTGGYTRYGYGAYLHTWDNGSELDLITATFRELNARYVCREASGSCLTEDQTTYTPTVVWQQFWENNQFMDIRNAEGHRTRAEFYQTAYRDTTFGVKTYSVREIKRYEYFGESTLLRTTQTDYTDSVSGGPVPWSLPIRVTTTLNDTNQVSKVETDYDTYSAYEVDVFGFLQTVTRFIDNPTERREYVFGSGAFGALVRRTVNSWLKVNPINSQNYQNETLHIMDRKASEVVCDGGASCTGSSIKAQTQFEYDHYTEGLSTSGAVQHEVAYDTNYTKRGNVTLTKRWRDTDGSWPETRNQYDDAGNVLKTTDPLTHPTLFSYADSWGNASCPPPGGNAAAYVKRITNALGQFTTSTYNSCAGTVASTTDFNNQTTTFSYDVLDRLIQTNFPDGGQVTQTYNETATPLSLTTSTKITAAMNLVSTATVDGLGRVVQSQLNSDPQGIVYVDTTYDQLGRKATVTNPYRSTSDPTFGITTFNYDALSRPTKVIPPDGSSSSNNITTSYSGNTVTVTDQAGKQRRSYTDALGRLTQVDEPGPSVGGGGTPGTGSVNITGTEQSVTVQEYVGDECVLWFEGNCEEWQPVYQDVTYWDLGGVSITVNGFSKSVTYASSSTGTSIASALASAFNGDSASPVTASFTGAVVYLTSKVGGVASNYSLSATSWTNDPAHFASPSFVPVRSGPTLTGGTDGPPGSGPLSLSTPTITAYTYDALGNLTNVLQGGSRPRAFTYNSLSQLTQAVNPESGIINYSYDLDGNLLTKVSPAPNQTGSATVTATFAYDLLHRLNQKSYSDTTPLVKYSYDGLAYMGCTSALSTANGIGRRTAMCDGAGQESSSYDALGRVLIDRRTTNSVTKDFTYAYNLDSSLASLTYPSGRMITYTLHSSGSNSAGRMVSAADSTNGINYAQSASYAPQGALASLQNGANIVSTYYYNNRLQPCRISVKSSGTAPIDCISATVGNVLDFTYSFNAGTANNGNVASIANNRNTNRSLTYTYDELNRIDLAYTQATSGGTCWGLDHNYDVWGNLLSISQKPTHNCTSTTLIVGVNAKNQISDSGFVYDAAGNLTNTPNPGGLAMQYDAENRMTSVAGTAYKYDGDGRRMWKAPASQQTQPNKLYWYSTGNDPLDETDGAGNTNNASFSEYVFFGGKRIAKRDSTDAINYYFADHLGTSRVVTNATGTILDDSDFYPFGREIVIASSSGSNYKFTGKERDTESGLDFFIARYYSSQYGRFFSPDEFAGGPVDVFSSNDPAPPGPLPYADISNPHSLNKYSYVYDAPLTNVDPNGHSVLTKIVKAVLKGQSILSTVQTVKEDLKVVFDSKADTLDRIEAGGKALSEAVLPFSASDAEDVGKLAGAGLAYLDSKGPLKPYDVGKADELVDRSKPGDGLDVHHAPQANPAKGSIPGYDPQKGPAIALPHDEHMKMNNTNIKGAQKLRPGELLAKTAKDLQKHTKAPKEALQALKILWRKL